MLSKIGMIFRSFYDKKAFVDLNKKQNNIFALSAILIILSVIPLFIKISINFSKFMEESVYPITDTIPEFDIIEGKMSFTDEHDPIELKIDDTVVGFIDPSKSISDTFSFDDPDGKIYFCGDGMVVIKPNGQVQAQAYPNSTTPLHLNGETVLVFLKFYPVGLVFTFFILIVANYARLLFRGLFFFLAAMLLSKMYGLAMQKFYLFSLGVFVCFPADMIETIVTLITNRIDMSLIYPAVALLYLNWALLSLRNMKLQHQAKDQD